MEEGVRGDRPGDIWEAATDHNDARINEAGAGAILHGSDEGCEVCRDGVVVLADSEVGDVHPRGQVAKVVNGGGRTGGETSGVAGGRREEVKVEEDRQIDQIAAASVVEATEVASRVSAGKETRRGEGRGESERRGEERRGEREGFKRMGGYDIVKC